MKACREMPKVTEDTPPADCATGPGGNQGRKRNMYGVPGIQDDEALIGMIANNDPLVALGGGSVYASALIVVKARPLVDPSTVEYDWWVEIEYDFHDAFEDVLDVHSNKPGFQEIAGGMGFDIDETWYWMDSGTVEFHR
jgi:hypothetical protein